MVGYIRVSTEDQKENFSLEFQSEKIKEYCLDNGLKLKEIYEEVGSGTSMEKRPRFTEMFNTVLNSTDITHIIVVMDDRFARNHKDAVNLVEMLSTKQKYLISIADNINTENPDQLTFFYMKSVFAEANRSRIVFNVEFGMQQRAKNGLFTGGRVTGYDSINKRLKVNERESELVKDIFNRYVNSQWGYRKIALHLNRLQHKTINGEEWTVFAIRNILSNPIYTGKILYKDHVYPGRHKAIIAEDMWEKAQSRLRDNNLNKVIKNIGLHFLSGIIKCPDCEGSMVHHKQGKYAYYQCSNNKNGKSCSANLIPKAYLEQKVLEHLHEVMKSPTLQSIFACKITMEINSEIEICKEAIANGNKELKSFNKKLSKTYDLFYKDGSEFHTRQIHQLEALIRASEAHVVKETVLLSYLLNRDTESFTQDFFDNFDERFNSWDNNTRVKLVRSLFEKIEITKADKPKNRKVKSIITYFDVENLENLVKLEL
ncbi:hypothetical protein CSV69_13725 [Sporosarcina sp. P26b]|uniref:recombinase family protein n=1 Tax=Sporosarcina sp. P26b TaxID=2048253 RepID=UPI000C16F14E|nr:recombinase family protein [Sporosarcina sp. P26b]PIC95061.1 hypothetical protein CSV69_13725 [Sporosarcina sp. P26b]